MSSESQQKRTRLNLEVIEKFFEDNEISMECPICKTSSWGIPNSQSIGGNAIPWGPGDGNMFMTGLPVLVMVCAKCKFVRQHSLLKNGIPGAVEEF